MTVLIVEDEALLLKNLVSCLTRAGIEAVGSASFAEARERLQRDAFDLICADISLGDGDGIELIGSIRADSPDLPVVVMTGRDSVSNRLRAEQIDASAFLAKPFALARFRELVATLLNEDRLDGPDHALDRPPSVMMYSHDTIGLGHMRRNSAIAGEVVKMMPRASVLMMVGSPAGVVFDLPFGVDFIKLPSLTKVSRSVWRPGSLRISSAETRDLRTGLIERAVESFRPDILLVDHEPFGVWDELVRVLESLRADPRRPRVVLGLRDILDDPERTRQAWARDGIAARLGGLYDDILIYGDPDIFPSHTAYGLDNLVGGSVRYCGYVTPAQQFRRQESRGNGVPRIIVAGGGGRDSAPMMERALAGLELMPERVRQNALLISGPLMDTEIRDELERRTARAAVNFRKSVPSLPALLAEADLFVSMAGYNALTEALVIGCPTLVIPRVGPSAEQRIRAKLFAERGLVDTIPIDEATPEALAARFRRVAAGSATRASSFQRDGAYRAAKHIAEHLAARHPRFTTALPAGVCHV